MHGTPYLRARAQGGACRLGLSRAGASSVKSCPKQLPKPTWRPGEEGKVGSSREQGRGAWKVTETLTKLD